MRPNSSRCSSTHRAEVHVHDDERASGSRFDDLRFRGTSQCDHDWVVATTSASPRYKRLALALAGVLLAAFAVWFVAARADADVSPCRQLGAPSEVLALTEVAIADLRSHESKVDPGDLTTPSEQQAEAVTDWQRYPRDATWVCGMGGSDEVAVISHTREEDNSYRCYGPAESCPRSSRHLLRVWVTCYYVLDQSPDPRVTKRGCIESPHD
jgi:hypothetical protein